MESMESGDAGGLPMVRPGDASKCRLLCSVLYLFWGRSLRRCGGVVAGNIRIPPAPYVPRPTCHSRVTGSASCYGHCMPLCHATCFS
jgi:hypothetical protein